MTADIIAIIAAVTLSVFILGTLILPFCAGLNHFTYTIVSDQIITGAIAALSGIITAIAIKKIKDCQ